MTVDLILSTLVLCSSILVACLIIFQDIKHHHISVIFLGLFTALSGGQFYLDGMQKIRIFGLLMMIILIGFITLYERLREKSLLGLGDKILYMCCCGWLSAQQLPLLILFSGVLGVIFVLAGAKLCPKETPLKEQPIPFSPAILISLAILRMF